MVIVGGSTVVVGAQVVRLHSLTAVSVCEGESVPGLDISGFLVAFRVRQDSVHSDTR